MNAWKVIWRKNNRRVWKKFEGDSPSPAVAFAKRVKKAGYFDVEVVSMRQGFACPASKQKLGKAGQLWCPYCLKWREFRNLTVNFPTGASEAYRCPVCYISTRDYYVRRYNVGNIVLVHAELEPVKLRVSRDSAASMASIKKRRRR